jgi:uncharacterized protein (DUF1330 family)
MPAYLLAKLTVTDPALYAEYRGGVAPVVARFGGEFLVRGGEVHPMEGAAPDRVVVIRFPDLAAARAFYDSADYAPLLALRLRAATGSLAFVEGVS